MSEVDFKETYLVYNTELDQFLRYLHEGPDERAVVAGCCWCDSDTHIFRDNYGDFMYTVVADINPYVERYKTHPHIPLQDKLNILNWMIKSNLLQGMSSIVFVPVTIMHDRNGSPVNCMIKDMDIHYDRSESFEQFTQWGEEFNYYIDQKTYQVSVQYIGDVELNV